MLAGAVVIIVQAPRCKPIPEMHWWNEGPLYQISHSSLSEGIKGIEYLPFFVSIENTHPVFFSNLLVITESMRGYKVSFNLDPGTTCTYNYDVIYFTLYYEKH